MEETKFSIIRIRSDFILDRNINFSENFRAGWYVLGLIGRMDTNTAPQAEDKIKIVLTDHLKVAIDFDKLNYISSAGLRVLLRVAKIANREGKEIVICGAKGMVQEILDDFDIEGFYTVYKTVDDLT